MLPPQPSQSSPEGSNSSQAMSFHCVETIQSFLPPLPTTEKLCSLEKISPDHDCYRVVWFPLCHWSRLITWPSYWLLIGQFTWTLNRQQTPTVPVPETHILRPPSCVCCLLQQSTFSLFSANKGSRFRLNTRHILYFLTMGIRVTLNGGSLSGVGCEVGAIIYKVKTGWVPSDLGAEKLLRSDWSARLSSGL